jgi:hypothetical protein
MTVNIASSSFLIFSPCLTCLLLDGFAKHMVASPKDFDVPLVDCLTMTRITPRTCLYPLTGSLLLTFGLSIGLTFQSDHHCYAGTCGEWLFPLQTRLHVIVWYFWISISVTFLAIRAFHPKLRLFLRQPLVHRKLPIIGKQLAVSGCLAFVWVVSLYGIIVGIWWVRLRTYFVTRGREGGVLDGNDQLAAVALTGHFCDVTMGMVLIPVSRHSALASFFKLSVSTTLAFHMIAAYTLFMLVLIHAFVYVSWVPVFISLSDRLRRCFPFSIQHICTTRLGQGILHPWESGGHPSYLWVFLRPSSLPPLRHHTTTCSGQALQHLLLHAPSEYCGCRDHLSPC